MSVEIRSPRTPREWAGYYEFRWRLLREPWEQPPGSEKDSFESTAHHLIAIDDSGELVGIGRVHEPGPKQAQIRYVAAKEDRRGLGIGSAIVAKLEEIAAAIGADEIVLNARESVVSFYELLGYRVIGAGPTLFGSLRHKRMSKRLQNMAGQGIEELA